MEVSAMYAYKLSPSSFSNIDRKTVIFSVWSGCLQLFSASFVPLDDVDLVGNLRVFAHFVSDLLAEAREDSVEADFDCSLSYPVEVRNDAGDEVLYFSAGDFVEDML